MHKKSTGMRKPESEDKLAGLWEFDHLKKGANKDEDGPERGPDETTQNPENSLEDVAIDLSSSSRQETKKMPPGSSTQLPQPPQVGAS
jgi:homeobox protein 1